VVGSTPDRYHMVSTWTGQPFSYITNTNVNSAIRPSVVGKSRTGLSGWGYSGTRSLVSCHSRGMQVDTVSSHMTGNAR